MTYSGTNLTGVKYFTRVDKGTSKVLRAELVLTYDGSNNLVSVTKVDI